MLKYFGLMFGLALLALGGRAEAGEELCRALDRHVEASARRLMKNHDLPGLVLALTVDGQRCYYNYGVSSRKTGRAVSEETLFEIGSLSKTFTAVLAALAQAEGRLSLSDPVSRHLPELSGSAFDRISLLHLAAHASGLPLNPPAEVKNADQLRRYFLNWRPPYDPGTGRTYSNPGIHLLGRAAAAALGDSFTSLVEKKLFPELGLSGAYIQTPGDSQADCAQGYDKNGRPVRLTDSLISTEAYAVKSSARDVIAYLEAYMGLAEVGPELRRALDETLVARYQVGGLNQALVWEYYDYPTELATFLAGGASGMYYKDQPARPLDPADRPKPAALYNKTGSTAGFAAYAAFVPAEKAGLVLLANRPLPIEERMLLGHQIFSELGRPGLRPPKAD